MRTHNFLFSFFSFLYIIFTFSYITFHYFIYYFYYHSSELLKKRYAKKCWKKAKINNNTQI